ncbi:MAG: GDSL-type esterase/lipase family protein [Planctomycetes bacterium]|jgi:lysophospholipase L1-like esterase|nr:GDSL-type esterase/lipase family protein [Planctomycetota bacterium]
MLRTLPLVLSLFLGHAALMAQATRKSIVCIGDSITEGFRATPSDITSYRRPLWNLLRANNHCVDFVGPEIGISTGTNDNNGPDYPKFDQDHFGWYGEPALAVSSKLALTPSVSGDIALIHLGSNDLLIGMSNGFSVPVIVDSVKNSLSSIIAVLRSRNPHIDILIARIVPLPNYPSMPGIDSTNMIPFSVGSNALNLMIDTLPSASGITDASSRVRIVDMNTGFLSSYLYDAVHPNPIGESFIAQQWYNAMIAHGMLPAASGSNACCWQQAHHCWTSTAPKPVLAPITPPRRGTTFTVSMSGLSTNPTTRAAIWSSSVENPWLQVHAMRNCFMMPANPMMITSMGNPIGGTISFSFSVPSNMSIGEEHWQGISTDYPHTELAITNALIVRFGN